MASSQAASVASRTGSPCPMTPRSKIRALLATVESSDEEGEGTKVKPKRPSFLQGIGQHRAHGSPGSVHEEEEDSDDSEPVIRPRGKLASRMQGAETTTTTGTKSPERAAAAARERVRTMLLQDDSATKAGEEGSNGDDEDEDEDEDEDLPIAPRRQKRRAAATLDDSEQEQEQQQQQQQRPMSPGLFVSSPLRPSPSKSMDDNEDSDNDLPALKSDRFKMLVERKRQERLAREAAEEARKAEQRARQEKLASEMEQLASDDSDGDGITDDEAGRRLTQEARPTRKASRKAIEEMNRETQRLARNMQLAHEAKTKKRISKQSLFQRFNYKPAGHVEPEPRTHSSSRPSTPHSDAEMNVNDAATPPSSPPAFKDIHSRTAATDSVHASTAQLCKDTEPGSPRRANEPGQKQQEMQDQNQQQKQKQKQTRRVRVRLPILPVNPAPLDSDDELQITATTKNKLDVLFDSIPSKMTSESHSIHALRALAQVKSPGKTRPRRDDQSGMTPGELQAYLHLKARQQAKMERERRLEILRGQGIVVQTAEEREKQEQEVEDLVAKARQEAQNIRETEKDEARRLRKMNGEVDPLAWDDSEDEEYRDAVDEDADEDEDAAELDVSGSEDDEIEGDAEDELEKDGIASGKVLFDDEADSSASEHEYAEAQEDEEDEEEGDMAARPAPRQRRARNTTVLSDDEGGVDVTPKPIKLATQVTPAGAGIVSPGALNSVLRSAKKTFIPGFPVQGPAGLGLTQIFAGTMDTSQTSDFADNEPTQSMMPDFEHFPDSNFSATADEPMEDIIIDSQQRQDSLVATQVVQLNLSQSQMHGLDSLVSNGMQTQMSEMIEPSQDVGLQQHTPLRQRFIEPPISTIETLLAADRQDDEHDMTIQDSPLVRKGRLRRRMDMPMTAGTAIAEASGDGDGDGDGEEQEQEQEQERANVPSTQADAFKALQEAAAQKKQARKTRHTADDFDRKKSKAKAMVEEQAEESEDEYAGLGGADGEDSDNASTGSVEDMIDDAAGHDADERKLAAFYA
ncbi:hypothetical protein E4U54_002467 [Claviceps lovelessii]|nr:hypothetical protein E4U54_002467 [Claviceps lovelessii]